MASAFTPVRDGNRKTRRNGTAAGADSRGEGKGCSRDKKTLGSERKLTLHDHNIAQGKDTRTRNMIL